MIPTNTIGMRIKTIDASMPHIATQSNADTANVSNRGRRALEFVARDRQKATGARQPTRT
jgi:hypothetical protein